MPWSRYTRHNGQPVPHLAGKLVMVSLADGTLDETVPHDGHGGSWTWAKTAGRSRVLSYRVWQDPIETTRELEKEETP